jgi:pimeloyl-ACP methyl ester carboxylesterase
MHTTRGSDGRRMKRLGQDLALVIGLAWLPGALGPTFGQAPEAAASASQLLPGSEEGFVDSGGVKIHYVSLGRTQDPLIVMIHGFPDFWYSWRVQMPALAKQFHVVAIDQRGYNLSGQPEGVENYTVTKLVGDLLKANYPRDATVAARQSALEAAGSPAPYPPVTCPVLLIHGLKDEALLPGALNDTWNWIDSDLTLVTIPAAGHFVQQDASDLVTRTMVSWLRR